MSEQRTSKNRVSRTEKLRLALEERAFHRGQFPGFKDVEYCDFCSYSRNWINEHGHGDHCLLRASI